MQDPLIESTPASGDRSARDASSRGNAPHHGPSARWQTRCAVSLLALTAMLGLTVPAAHAGPAQSILTVADFNQDGVTDLLAERISGVNQGLLWVMLMDGSDASLLGSEFPLQLQDGYEFLAVGNFNGNIEGQSQIAARKTSGTPAGEIGGVRVWDLNDDASATVTAAEGSLIMVPDPMYSLVGIGDMDGNGVDDFVFIQDGTGPNPGLIRVYLMNTSMQVQQIAHALIVNDYPGLELFGIADVTGDGIADIVLANRNPANRNLRIFVMEEDATFGIAISEQLFAFSVPPTDYDFLGFALIDPGGRADLVYVKNGAPNEGLVRIQLVPAITSGVAGQLSPFHPTNLGTSFDYVGSGLLDSDTESDLILIRNGGATEGQVKTLLLEVDTGNLASTDHVDSSTFPVRIVQTDWDERTTGPVTIP